MQVLLTEQFAAAVDEHLAAFEPERMLHALGQVRPDGSVLLSHWVADGDADASGLHVRASAAGESAMQAVEREHGVTYLGVIHSHPRTHPEPSGQDERAVADLLEVNSHLPVALVGVVVSAVTGRRGRQVLPVGRGELVIGAMPRGSGRLDPADLLVTSSAGDFWSGAAARLPTGALDAVRDVHVTIVGTGSLGATAAEQMARAGVPRFTLIDPDRVEAHNLTRTTFSLADVGRRKVDAVADRLRSINPGIEVDTHTWPVEPASATKLADIVADSTVVLGLADAPRALALLDTVLHAQDVPGVYAGVYRGAVGADVVTVLPGLTACYRCTVAPRAGAVSLQPGVDYTTGRISGAMALGADVTLVAVLTARVALGVVGLLRGTDRLLEAPAIEGRNFLQVGLAPGFFDATGLFADVPGQHALQTLWARATGDPQCRECGQAHEPTTLSAAPDRSAARTAAAPQQGPAADSPQQGPAGTPGTAPAEPAAHRRRRPAGLVPLGAALIGAAAVAAAVRAFGAAARR